jgi:hypothetical protein
MSAPPLLPNGEPPFYPGLRLPERIVLAAWQRIHASDYSRYEYNVRLGQGHDPGPSFTPEIRKMAVMNAQKKIDVVAYDPLGATLVEVKERATPGAIGQLITYSHLWEAENAGAPPPLLRIIAARVSPGVIEAAQRVGIVVEIVAADFSIVRGRV